MIDSYLRTSYQKCFVDPVVKRNRFPPNFLTLSALILGIYLIPLIAFGFTKTSLLFLIFSGYLDTLDGSVARALKKTSPTGAVYDIVSDRIVESSIILGLLLFDYSRGLLCLLMLASVLICVTSFLVVGIFLENSGEKSFHYHPGIMERSEAFIFFGLMIALPSYFTFLASAFTVLVLLTALIRIVQFAK